MEFKLFKEERKGDLVSKYFRYKGDAFDVCQSLYNNDEFDIITVETVDKVYNVNLIIDLYKVKGIQKVEMLGSNIDVTIDFELGLVCLSGLERNVASWLLRYINKH